MDIEPSITPTQQIEQEFLIYSINEEDKTATVIGNNYSSGEIYIPSSIKYESKEYTVISISENSLSNLDDECKSIQFATDSKVRTIEQNAFDHSRIISITIPSSLIELKEGWCEMTVTLNNIEIMPTNQRYKKYGDSLIIGKSTISQENYDVLVFCSREATSVTIPNFIEYIDPYAFEGCSFLENIEFEKDSKLREIGKFSFRHTGFKRFDIPSSLTKICEGSFSLCRALIQIEISDDSKLSVIEKNAFSDSRINSFSIPKSLSDLNDEWCFNLANLNTINVASENNRYKLYDDKFVIGKSDPSKEKYDVLVFCVRDIEKVEIPDFIEIISPYCFQLCKKLVNVEFSEKSELRIISKGAFDSTFEIESISIPQHVTHICEEAFKFCHNLKHVEIQPNSELQTIEKKAFYESLISEIRIPSSLIDLKILWCYRVNNLTKIIMMPNNPRYKLYNDELILGKSDLSKENYDVLVFASRNIKSVKIPDFVEIIGNSSFLDCKMLNEVEISENSKLRIIEAEAFLGSSITSIKIPPSLECIEIGAFSSCKQLLSFEIPPNSHLHTIHRYAFYNSDIEEFKVPPSLTFIGEGTFKLCQNLNRFIVPTDSKLQTIEQEAFYRAEIESIAIPSSLVDLKNMWCINTIRLNDVKIMPDNKRYTLYENKFIIGKSSLDKDVYDTLVFAPRGIKMVKIPDFIEIIAPYAFHKCKKLRHVEFAPGSKLRLIEKAAFNKSAVEKISIPPCVRQINEIAFSNCLYLRVVDIPQNSELRIVQKDCFSCTALNDIFFPQHLTQIGDCAFREEEIKIIEIGDNSELKFISSTTIPTNSNLKIMIPANLTIQFNKI